MPLTNNTGPPSTPTVDQMEYSVVDKSTGQFTLLVSSNGTFGTGVTFYASVEGSDSVKVTDNNITVTRLSYTESHTVSVVATSAVCPGVLNSSSIDFPVIFNIRSECNQCIAYPAQGVLKNLKIITKLYS